MFTFATLFYRLLQASSVFYWCSLSGSKVGDKIQSCSNREVLRMVCTKVDRYTVLECMCICGMSVFTFLWNLRLDVLLGMRVTLR